VIQQEVKGFKYWSSQAGSDIRTIRKQLNSSACSSLAQSTVSRESVGGWQLLKWGAW
jgi:hypothetical protein